MNAAFATGTAGFPSIAGAAKDAGASWSGSIDNMKAAITRGTASMLTSFDKMFNVKAGMVSFGKAIEKALKGIADNMTFIAPTAIAATSAIAGLKITKSVASLMGTMKTASGNAGAALELLAEGSKASEIATLGLTSAEKLSMIQQAAGNVVKSIGAALNLTHATTSGVAAGATLGFAAAMKALGAAVLAAMGPFAAIALIIVAVVAAVSAITNAVKNANKEYYAEKDALKELKEEHEGYAEALQESKQAALEEGQEKVAQAQANRELMETLAELVDENGNVTGSMNKVQSVVRCV